MGKRRAQKARGTYARRRLARARRQRLVWFSLGAAVVLGAAVLVALAPLRPTRPGSAGVRGEAAGIQDVVVNMAGFDPQHITALAGKPVTLRFINPDSQFHTDGGGWHQFRVESLGVDLRIPPRSQKVLNLGVLRAGRYEFYCDICCGGKANPSMRGVLEVKA